MTAAAKTLIPTAGPLPRAEPVEQLETAMGPTDPWAVADRSLRLVDRLTTPSSSGQRDPVRAAVVAALVVSVLCWGAHEVLGGRAAIERNERTNARIKALEDQQMMIRIELAGISRAVGAKPAE